MNKPSRPCLKCRALFIPSKDSPSYCSLHKPTKRQNTKRKPHYNDPEYRRNRNYLIKEYGRCFRCNTGGTPNNKLEIDHIVPVSEGGTNRLSNLRILCQNCHRLRHIVEKYRK